MSFFGKNTERDDNKVLKPAFERKGGKFQLACRAHIHTHTRTRKETVPGGRVVKGHNKGMLPGMLFAN